VLAVLVDRGRRRRRRGRQRSVGQRYDGEGAGGPAEAGEGQSQFSRLPVYPGALDTIVGLLTSWDVIARPEAPIRSPRPVSVAAPEEFCQVILTRMLRERRHLAIVRGTAGETLGLVTLEDLVEEIIGDIHDEHDEPGHDVGGESATR
jgi:CBS domain containing-hemolysin-like protein